MSMQTPVMLFLISLVRTLCVCVQYLGWLSGTSERNSIRRERKVTRAGRDNRRRERGRAPPGREGGVLVYDYISNNRHKS